MKPTLTLESLSYGGNKLIVDNELSTFESTYLKQDYSSGVTTLNIDNASDFSRSIFLIGALGQENSEIVTKTSQTDTTITISATKFPHSRGEKVSAILYNQIQFEVSADNVSFTTLGTAPIQVTNLSTSTLDTNSNFYYRAKFIGPSVASEYSDTVIYTTSTNSAISIINQAKKLNGVSTDDKSVTTDFLLACLNEGRRYVDNLLYGYQMDWRNVYQFPIPLIAGRDFVDLPTDIDFTTNNRSILRARIGSTSSVYSGNLPYVDKSQFNEMTNNRYNHLCYTLCAIGGTSLTLNSTYDLGDTGTLYVAGTDPDDDIMIINFTANSKSTSTLTVSGVTREIPVNAQVWTFPLMAYPEIFTVYSNYLFFDKVIPNTLRGKMLLLDYYSKLTDVEGLGYELPEHYRYIYVDYLTWRIKKLKDKRISEKDDDFLRFMNQVEIIKNQMYTGQTAYII